jgi:ribosome-binding ATPase YchF (GTP1/OBG family)
MGESVISEIRQLLQDMIAPDLKSLALKMDGLQRQMELSQKATEAQLDAFRVEQSAFRSEMNAFRAEMRAEFQAQRNLLQNEVLRETSPIRERLATLEAHDAHS